MTLFRYPGGKSKLQNKIVSKISSILEGNDVDEYREPFFGGGSIGLALLDNPSIKRVWINDKDFGISCLWTAVIQYPEELKAKVAAFTPSIEKFDEIKKLLRATDSTIETAEQITEFGFMKLAINQISFSGLGTMAGGPQGGRGKTNIAGDKELAAQNKVKYPIDCRWNSNLLLKKIDQLHGRLSRMSIKSRKCTCLDFEELINDCTAKAITYLDPPYYEKGSKLYQEGFTDNDHKRLAAALRETEHLWVLSYDDNQRVRELYKWASIEEIKDVHCSINGTKDSKTHNRKTELLICSSRLDIGSIKRRHMPRQYSSLLHSI